MYKDHPSITKIKNITECFHFTPVNEESISEKVNGLDKKKASTFNGIPPEILAENYDIISPFIAKIYNDSNLKMLFPVALKFADITPTHKKDDTTNKENYRPVSILSSVFDYDQDHIFNIITMYKDHPSITKIKNITECFHFTPVNEESISEKVNGLDKKKASTFNGIPPEILAENYDIISPFIAKIYNDSNLKMLFPVALKFADITPTHKKDDTTNKENYRPVSILSSVFDYDQDHIFNIITMYKDHPSITKIKKHN